MAVLHFSMICRNYRIKLLSLGTQFYYFSPFKILIANLDRESTLTFK